MSKSDTGNLHKKALSHSSNLRTTNTGAISYLRKLDAGNLRKISTGQRHYNLIYNTISKFSLYKQLTFFSFLIKGFTSILSHKNNRRVKLIDYQ